MTKDEIGRIVKQVISDHFAICEVSEENHLWNDFEADDLAYIEIFMELEELFDKDFDCLDSEECRLTTVQNIIDHVDRITNN